MVPPLGGGGGYRQHLDYDEPLESAVLGVCLIEPQSFGTIYTLLTQECFYTQANAQVYAAMNTLWEKGAPVDLLTLSRELYDNNITEIRGYPTAYYLTSLTKDIVNSAHLQHWCLMLRELAARRMMISLTSTRFSGDDVITHAEHIQQQIKQALDIRATDDWLDASAAALALTKHMDDAQNKDRIGVSTTFHSIDKINGGFRPGQLVVIGARPSVGKSALMGAIATQAAMHGTPTGVISLEMPAADLFGRMVSADTHIPFTDIDRNRITEDDQRTYIYQSITRPAGLPLWFSDTAQVNIHDIRAKAEKLKRRHGLGLLIIDYLQLIEETTTTATRNREQNISAISRGLKMLAMNLGIPVIALSQLNRESEARAHKRPSMADLRESGAIEQDADIIMLLHRDWRCGITTDAHGHSTEHQADLLIPKWRNGTPLDLKLHFHPHTMRFEERT
ncbi:replicative DNA helicase [Polluticoccus soli]|uniref:replicative DNA helicase n=1 Tax=Polluticoccus soli TaxID=3034150 RepID=UPI0023E19862|nr:DnaB-like helicase C-terminal domain-containing protein [Flavipsychrobacter sp. JY13-12]